MVGFIALHSVEWNRSTYDPISFCSLSMSDDSHAFTGKCVGQSLALSLQYIAGGVLAVPGGLIACPTDGSECQVHKKYLPKWALSSEHSIGLTFSLKGL